jgi:hypothetical protein
MSIHAGETLREGDFEQESTGAAEKIPVTDDEGKIDSSFIRTILAKELTAQTWNYGVSSAEKTLLTATLPAGLLGTDDGVRYYGVFSHASPGHLVDVPLKFKLNGTTLLTIDSTAGSDVNTFYRSCTLEIIMFNNGSDSSQSVVAILHQDQQNHNDDTRPTKIAIGTGTIDTSSEVTLTVTVTPSGVSEDGTMFMQTLEVL